jgi:hypothetical protein
MTATFSISELKFTLGDKSFRAISGSPSHQSLDEIWTRGKGPIPPGDYTIETFGDIHPKVESFAFHILPDPIINPDDPSKIRSELFLHADMGVPGTAGCIGVQLPTEWGEVCWIMGRENMEYGHGEIALKVMP